MSWGLSFPLRLQKKKRKRITKEFDKVATSKASGNIKKEDTPFVKKDKDKENKDNAAKKPHNNNPKKKKEVKKVVVSDEEVKKQIHETLSHLEQKGKSKLNPFFIFLFFKISAAAFISSTLPFVQEPITT